MMMSRFILAISTSSGIAKVAIATECSGFEVAATVLVEFEIVDYSSQSALLLPMIQQHLKTQNLFATECAAIAVDVGPGGFTSLRTACGVAQGLSLAWSVPVVALTSFECMLFGFELDQPVSICIDARLNEFYVTRIQRTLQGTYWLKSPQILQVDALLEEQGPLICDAKAFSVLPALENQVYRGRVCVVQLVRMAWQEFNAGRVVSSFECQPLYIRDKVAQTIAERLAIKHGAV